MFYFLCVSGEFLGSYCKHLLDKFSLNYLFYLLNISAQISLFLPVYFVIPISTMLGVSILCELTYTVDPDKNDDKSWAAA